ncbi:glycine cleavage system protein R [Nocardioides campestrisoli]|uniref:glycine cleavage system protein R n=1 Tax=Nocardioides campestrisoli TaxID=2736757 RepID=UPI0015E67E2A|nr:ACT domain-containing protein [Nocardioides campestrisoli]
MTDAGTLHAITVVGHDRPGIIAETTDRLAALGLNIEDTSMTLLRGHFAMTLVCAGSASDTELEGALAPLAEDGTLTVTVREVPREQSPYETASAWVLTVHGGDRPGIVSRIAAEVARVGGNITDLTTRLSGDLYLLLAEVALPADADVEGLERAVKDAAEALGVGASLRPAEADEL